MRHQLQRRTIVALALVILALATTSTAAAAIGRTGQRPATIPLTGTAMAGTAGVAGDGAAVAGSDAAATIGTPREAVTVPQVRCPTTYGYTFTQPPVNPTVPVTIPVVVRPLLTAYANDTAMIVAPLGWKCVGRVGADASWILTVTDTHNAQATIATAGAASCYGCALTIAAPYFPSAASLLKALCGASCVPVKPAGTISTLLGSQVAYFETPPATGRPYRTRGVVVYVAGSGSTAPLAARATCTVPSASVYLCQPILAAFVAEFDVTARW